MGMNKKCKQCGGIFIAMYDFNEICPNCFVKNISKSLKNEMDFDIMKNLGVTKDITDAVDIDTDLKKLCRNYNEVI